MKDEIKKKWLSEMKSGKYKHVGHCIKCGDMYDAMGILCLIHSEETKTEWQDNLYMGCYVAAPKAVLEWSGLTESQQSQIIILNNEFDASLKRSYDFVIKYVGSL